MARALSYRRLRRHGDAVFSTERRHVSATADAVNGDAANRRRADFIDLRHFPARSVAGVAYPLLLASLLFAGCGGSTTGGSTAATATVTATKDCGTSPNLTGPVRTGPNIVVDGAARNTFYNVAAVSSLDGWAVG